MIYQVILILFISTIIGYLTNVIAVRMLFRPRNPIDLGFYQVQGLLPKRQRQIAASVGELVDKELLSLKDVLDKVNTPEVEEMVVQKVTRMVTLRLTELLPKIIPARMVQIIADLIEKILRQETPELIRQVMEAGTDYLSKEIQVNKIVEDKINNYDLQQLEDIIRGISITELTFIEVLGGILGFLIGLIQVTIMYLLPVK
jgi:uncharacterized membrane protein YheB (UPF0754 family)